MTKLTYASRCETEATMTPLILLHPALNPLTALWWPWLAFVWVGPLRSTWSR